MDPLRFEARWQTLTAVVITEMADWRVAHPKATLKEIETALDERLDRVRACMLEDIAQASRQTTWEAQSAEAPRCPECGQPLQSAGKRRRRLRTQGDQSITLERQYGVCPACGRGLFPPG